MLQPYTERVCNDPDESDMLSMKFEPVDGSEKNIARNYKWITLPETNIAPEKLPSQ